MTDSLVPDWIKQIKDKQDRETAEQKAQALQTALVTKTIQADGPAFWKQLLKELQINVDGLSIIGVRAALVNLGGHGEESYQISASRESASPGLTHTNLHYTPGGGNIRCFPDELDPETLAFGVYGNALKVASRDTRPMSAEQAAQYLAESMLKNLDRG